MYISQKELKELLTYDPKSGVFRWKERRNGRVVIGAEAGSITTKGYRRIGIKVECNGVRKVYLFRAHRLAWVYVHGIWPTERIDHKNRDGLDNRIDNLRVATHSQNLGNRKRNANNKSGYKGVYKHRNKWRACIRENGKTKNLGTFDNPVDAHAAYTNAAQTVFGEFARAA